MGEIQFSPQHINLEHIRDILTRKDEDVVKKIRCLFDAKYHGGVEAVQVLQIACQDSSVLVAHEAAYVLGQLGEDCAIPFLVSLLSNENNHCMVRHEAAEAIAAIGDVGAIEILKKYVDDVSIPVKETCVLALRRLQELRDQEVKAVSKFNTVDPVLQPSTSQKLDLHALSTCLHDTSQDLWNRYEALFALRDLGTPEAYKCIAEALSDRTSALFRHEVAFVLGQVQCDFTAEPLIQCLANADEHSMARHEAALALGSIGAAHSHGNGKKTQQLIHRSLCRYSTDPDPIVAESCLVALDNMYQECGGHDF